MDTLFSCFHKPNTKLVHQSKINSKKKKYLVLDLDETLVHTMTDDKQNYTHKLQIYIENQLCTFYVHERPHLHEFMKYVCDWYHVIIFTASIATYADQVIDRIDRTHRIHSRYYRNHCKKEGDQYIKDLSVLKVDLAKCILVDNSHVCYSVNPENAYPIEPYLGDDENDQELLHLLRILDGLRFVDDVRSLLALRIELQ